MSRRMSTVELQQAVELANVPTLLSFLVHQTGETTWLEPPFTPRRSRGIEDPDDGGLAPDVVDKIRSAAFAALERHLAGEAPQIPVPDAALALRMISATVGEEVPPEYGEMIAADIAQSPRGSARAPDVDLDALIIGAGVSGIAAAVRMAEQGIRYTVVERNPAAGGVWAENRYPGAAVDTPSHLYSYSFAPNDWSRWFCGAEEIHGYLLDVARDRGVLPHIRFSAWARRAAYDAERDRWVVEVDTADGRTETLSATLLISAVGAFNQPVIPPIPGRQDFAGQSFHSARWPPDAEVRGRKVAVIGNGASAMQIVPAIADEVTQLTVFQLEPHWIAPFPRFEQQIPQPVRHLLTSVPLYYQWYRARLSWLFNDKLYPLLRRDPEWPDPERSMNAASDRYRQFLTDYIVSEVGDRTDLLADLVPDYPPLGKRLLLDNGWYRAFRRPNVELLSSRVTRIDHDGLVTESGRSVEADVIVFATGFDVVSFLSTIEVVGRSGQKLSEVWDGDDAAAFLGMAVPEFPNLFILYGPNTQSGHGGSLISQVEAQLTHLVDIVRKMQDENLVAVEVRQDVHDAYVKALDDAHAEMVWTHPGVETYYRNSRGRVVVNNAYRVVDFWQRTQSADMDSYRSKRQGDTAWDDH